MAGIYRSWAHLTLFILASFAIGGCSAPNEIATPKSGSLVAVDVLIDTCGDKFFEFADQTGGDAQEALALTADWLATHPDVLAAMMVDSSFVDIELRSGLRTCFSINLLDRNGRSEFRGGGNGESGSKLKEMLGENSKYTIKNKKVLIFAAENSFYAPGQLENLKTKIEDSDLGLQVTVLEGAECNYLALNHFSDYGLVIIETHGKPYGFFVGSTAIDPTKWFANYPVIPDEEFGTLLDNAAGAGTYAKVKSGELEYVGSVDVAHYQPDWQRFVLRPKREILVTTEYLATISDMPTTVVFGNMCYSGYTKPIPGRTPIATAFINRSVITYFGYAMDNGKATQVSNDFAKEMDDSVIKSLMYDLDSTGYAHLTDGGSLQTDLYRTPDVASTLRHFSSVDYSYEKGCVDSLSDARDGQVYRTICLGGQVWMKENLNYNYPGSTTYNGDPAHGAIYGRLYTYNMLESICPSGWHVPTEEDFNALEQTIGDPTGGKMKSTSSLWSSPNTGATNSSGFSALPGGFVVDIQDPANMSSNLGSSAILAMKLIDQGVWKNRGLLYDSETMDYFDAASLDEGVSCRCVKDK